MQTTDLVIPNKLGLHARAAASLVQLTQTFECAINLVKGEKRANAKSMLSIMTLNVKQHDSLTLEADGHDEAAAIRAVLELAANNFGDAE